jgi:ubiquinone/menaquinone biosynthesis C-methylase UbiE
MAEIVFNDGAAYERFMGVWSRLAGEVFLDWLAPQAGLRWVDVGCGNGAFTELIAQRCAPAQIDGIDPSEGQLAFARTRRGAEIATFHRGDAMTLPFADDSYDAAVMGLVIFFVPEPARAVAEMARVVRKGGIVASYAWDLPGGGFPLEPLMTELRALGFKPPAPPRPEASRIDVSRALWAEAGIEELETREITVQRSFADFAEFWSIVSLAPSTGKTLADLPSGVSAELQSRLRARLPADAAGRITYAARANAIKGRVAR